MLKKLKSKLHRHKNDEEKTVEALIKASPAPTPSPGHVSQVKEKLEKIPTSEQSVIAPFEKAMSYSIAVDEKPPIALVPRDLWRDALAHLPPPKQETLKNLGLGQIRSVSAESTINSLVAVVNQKQEECAKKFWKVSCGGEEIVLRDYTCRIVDWLEKAGDIAIQFAPVQASLAWDIVKSLMEIPVAEGAQMCALLGTTEKVVRIISRGQVYEQVYLPQVPGSPLDAAQQSLESGLLMIYATALELLADSGALFSMNTFRRTLEAVVNPDKAVGALAGIAEQEDEILRFVQACESKRSSESDSRMIGMLETFNDPIIRIDKGVNYVLEKMEEAERIKVLEWISSIPFGKNHDNIRERRTTGTGQWLLQHADFRSWENKRSSAILWLQGTAGTGKTYLTSSVVDRIRSSVTGAINDEGFAFFYCDRNDSRRAQPDSILQSFVRQLSTPAQKPQHIQSRITEAYEKARKNGSDFRPDQCVELVQDCLDRYRRTTLIIDAMDECDPDDRYIIMDALESFLINSKNPVKIFVSSRPDSDIREQLEDSSKIAISADANQEDIRSYLDAELDRMAQKPSKSFLKSVKESVIEKLLERCQGMFQWAYLQIHQILKCQTKSSLMKRLESLPDDIKAAYDEIWKEMECLDEPDKTLAKRALLWTMTTYKPFSSTELLSAIRIDLEGNLFPLEDQVTEQGLLTLCNNFLTIDTQSNVWRFSHLSVIEYLEAKEGWSRSKAHYQVASTCLSYFIKTYDRDFAELSPQIFDLDTDVAVRDEDILHADKEVDPTDLGESDHGFGRYHPFHIYMRQCWMHHTRKAQDTEKTLAALLKRFLGSPEDSSSQYRKWFNVLYKDGWYFFKSGGGHFYEWRHFGSASAGDIIHDIFDEKFAIFGMCRMGLEDILSDWWNGADFDVSQINGRGHSLLCVAVMAGSASTCQKLIERGANVNQRLEKHRTYGNALVAAVSFKRTDVIQCLLAAGADMNMLVATKNPHRSTALSAAVTARDTEIVECLLQNGKADFIMGYPDISNDGILFKAARTGNLEIIKLILEAGADVDTTFMSCSEHSGLLPQMIYASNVEGVEYLVKEAKADVNKRHGKDQLYPIELATSGFLGSAGLEILKLLCREGGADVNASSSSGKYGSALAAACASWGSDQAIEAAKCLLDAGADVNKQLTAGEYGSALAVAAKESYGIEIMELLINAGVDVNMQLENGPYGNALMAAQAGDYGDYKKVAYLLQVGANMEASLKPEAYRGAITAAVLANKPERVKAMVKAGAVVDVALEESDFGDLLAYSTILNFEQGILESLLAGGAPADGAIATGRYGTALIAAACFGQYQAAECLINAGAIVNIQTQCGDYRSPIEAAEAPFSEADKACIVKFCNFNGSEAENLLEKWGKQKGDVLRLLKERREPFTTMQSIYLPIITTYSAGEFAVSSNPPCVVSEGPGRLRSGNYVIPVGN